MDIWTAPEFVEIKMDAEIGSYQDDFEPLREESPIVTSGDILSGDTSDTK